VKMRHDAPQGREVSLAFFVGCDECTWSRMLNGRVAAHAAAQVHAALHHRVTRFRTTGPLVQRRLQA
jgi:hypothetical protein